MSSTKRQRGVILLERSSLDFYTSVNGSVYKLAFTPTAVSNFEIVDTTLFTSQIKAFLETNKISPSSLVLVLAESTLFTKTYNQLVTQQESDKKQSQEVQNQNHIVPQPPMLKSLLPDRNEQKSNTAQLAQLEAEQQVDIQHFFDYIPFETVLSKTYKLNEQTIAVATNGDFIAVLKKSFESFGSLIELVLPVQVLSDQVHVANGLSQEAAKVLIEKQIDYKQYNMLAAPSLTIPQGNVRENLLHGQTNKIRIIALIGVFLVLLIVAAVMFMSMLQENKRIKSDIPTPIPTISPVNDR